MARFVLCHCTKYINKYTSYRDVTYQFVNFVYHQNTNRKQIEERYIDLNMYVVFFFFFPFLFIITVGISILLKNVNSYTLFN